MPLPSTRRWCFDPFLPRASLRFEPALFGYARRFGPQLLEHPKDVTRRLISAARIRRRELTHQ